jgi:UDP-glucuronate 4-epimerase
MQRDFTYIDDIVTGVLACLDHAPAADGSAKAGGSVSPHAVYNIGNSRSERLGDMIDLIEDACGRKADRRYEPMQPGDVPATYADVSAIAADLGFAPTTTIETGVPRFVEWYRRYHDV